MSSFRLATSLLLALASINLGSSSPVSPRVDNSVTALGYFAGYHATRGAPVSDIPWTKYSHVLYSFAETNADLTFNLTDSNPDLIPEFVSAAKANGVKSLLSIGGWAGSRHFSTMLASVESRSKVIEECLKLVEQYGFDGLDFDWEYPNRQGLGCNDINADDTANFLAFLQELRQNPAAQSLSLIAAAPLAPWFDSNGRASTAGLEAFGDVLDFITLMNYDVYGAWSPTGGPNAPLDMSCDARNNQGAAKQGITSWTAAGFPASKILLGVPAYSHSFSVDTAAAFPDGTNQLALYPAQNSSDRRQGGSWDSDPAVDECGNASPPGGTFTFQSLVSEAKFLNTSGLPADGIAYTWDECSQTPVLYDGESQRWISYDDAQSLAAKGRFVKDNGLGGFSMFETGGDYNNILVDAIRGAVGLA